MLGLKSRASLRISFCVTASAVERTQGRPIRPICFHRQRNYHGPPALRASRPTRCLGPGTRKASATNADQPFQAFSWKGPWLSSQPGALIARLRSGRVLISALRAGRNGMHVWTTSRKSTVYLARFSTAKRSPASSVRFNFHFEDFPQIARKIRGTTAGRAARRRSLSCCGQCKSALRPYRPSLAARRMAALGAKSRDGESPTWGRKSVVRWQCGDRRL